MSSGQRKPHSKSFSAPVVLLCTLCIAALPTALAQAKAWEKVSSAGPSARAYHAMAYDSARGVTVLFGGWDGFSLFGDTWEWDGSSWIQVSSSGPSARECHAMAYDSARCVTVLFGGWDGSSYLKDTWEWDGSSWTQLSSTGPSVRFNHAMAYDSARGVTVLFGGYNPSSLYLGDTWEWDGSSWAQVSSSGPSARYSHAMAYDSARGVTVLFGGRDSFGNSRDTWEWDGSGWTQASSTGPSARQFPAMAYDSARGVTVLFGGGALPVYTWEWDGSRWAKVSSSGPSARWASAMAYDSARGVTVLFGGRDSFGNFRDTWECSLTFDLKAIFRKASSRTVMINGRLKVIAKVKNIGDVKSIPASVSFYLSADRTLDDNDILLGEKAIPALAPGKSKRVKKKFTVPSNINPGFYYVIVEVIASDANPGNNVRASKYKIQVY